MKFNLKVLCEATKSSIPFFPQSTAWLKFDQKKYLAVAGNSFHNDKIFQTIKIYEFNPKAEFELNKIENITTEEIFNEDSIQCIKWFEVLGKIFLVLVGDVGLTGEETKIFKFNLVTGKLEKIFGRSTQFNALWSVDFLKYDENDFYFVVCGDDGHLSKEIIVYKFKPDQKDMLEPIASAPILDQGEPAFELPKVVCWLKTQRGTFLAVAGDDGTSGQEIRIYRFNHQQSELIMIENAPANSTEDPSFSEPYDLDWLTTDKGYYLAVVGNDGEINQEEIRVYHFIRTHDIEHMPLVAKGPTNSGKDPSFENPRSVKWLQINQENFLAVGGDDIATHQPIRIYKFELEKHSLEKVAFAPSEDELQFPFVMSVDWLNLDKDIYLAAVGKGSNKREHHIRVYKFEY